MAKQDQSTETPDPDVAPDPAAAARIADLEAQLAAAKGSPGETRLAWIVTYPAISVQPKDADGKPEGDPVVFQRGARLSPETEWAGKFLASIGHVTALAVPA